MTRTNTLDELFADAKLPFGHPGRSFDDTPEHFDPTPITGQGPEPDHTPDEPDPVVHYAPGDRPLCGNNSMTASYSDAPYQVAGCDECLKLVAEDLQDHTDYRGRCLHCGRAGW